MKERNSDLIFELSDLHADRGLGAIELLGGRAKAAILGDRNEHVEEFEIDLCHAPTLIQIIRSIHKIISLERIVRSH